MNNSEIGEWTTIRPHFFMTLEMINEKPCYYCGGLDTYRAETVKDEKGKTKRKLARSEESEPGDFMQHENMVTSIGWLRVFECSRCHNVIFFRSHFEEEVDLLDKP